MTAIATRLADGTPRPGHGVTVTPLVAHLVADSRQTLLLLVATGLLVLVIGCVNLTSLLLLRTLARVPELSVRLALGASRNHIDSLWAIESAWVVGLGALGGMLLSTWGARLLVFWAPPDIPRMQQAAAVTPIVMMVTLSALVAIVISALVYIRLVSRLDLATMLRRGAQTTTSGPHRLSARLAVGTRLALTMMLTAAAVLMMRSAWHVRQVDFGFETGQMLMLNIEPRGLDDSRWQIFYDDLVERVRALPYVTAAASSYSRPFEPGAAGWDATILLEGQSAARRDWEANPFVNQVAVGDGYFDTLGIRLRHGRAFTAQDRADGATVVIVSERTASMLWPGRNAIGQRVQLPDAPKDANGREQRQEVVGVVGDVMQRGVGDVRLDVFVPLTQSLQRPRHLFVRTTHAPENAARAIADLARHGHSDVLVDRVVSMRTTVDRATSPWRFSMYLFGMLTIIALVLASSGVFGMLSRDVAAMRREIGVRMAFGARVATVRWLVARRALLTIAGGILVGALGAVPLMAYMEPLVFAVGTCRLAPSRFALLL